MRRTISQPFIIIIAAFILLIFFHSLEIFDSLEKKLLSLMNPLQRYFYHAGFSANQKIKLIKGGRAAGEIEILKAQIRGLLLQNTGLKLAAEENKLLKKELQFSRRHSYEMIPARVIGFDSSPGSNSLILEIQNEKYKYEDVKTGMPVVVEDGILVGKIAAIKQDRLYLRLLTASQSAVGATVLNKDYTTGVVEGEFNIGIKMKMIPPEEKLKQGDLIVTSGLEAEVPRGLLIGTVMKIYQDPQYPFNIAHLSPLYNFKNLLLVLIIKSY